MSPTKGEFGGYLLEFLAQQKTVSREQLRLWYQVLTGKVWSESATSNWIARQRTNGAVARRWGLGPAGEAMLWLVSTGVNDKAHGMNRRAERPIGSWLHSWWVNEVRMALVPFGSIEAWVPERELLAFDMESAADGLLEVDGCSISVEVELTAKERQRAVQKLSRVRQNQGADRKTLWVVDIGVDRSYLRWRGFADGEGWIVVDKRSRTGLDHAETRKTLKTMLVSEGENHR